MVLMTVNIKKYFLYAYLFLPLFIYGLPLIFSFYQDFSFHFYTTVFPTSFDLAKILLGHICLGLMIVHGISILGRRTYSFKGIVVEIIIIISFLGLVFFNTYVKVLLSPILFYMLANSKIRSYCLYIFILIGILALFFKGERIFITFGLLLFFKNWILKTKTIYLISSSFIFVLLMVFILQPLKNGFQDFSLDFSALNIFYHLNPIYLNSVFGLLNPVSFIQAVAEMTPFLKSILGIEGEVFRLSHLALPNEILQQGVRLGSNSSSIFNITLFPFISFLLISLFSLLKKINIQRINNTVILYFFLMSPHFVRRSILSFLNDILIIIIFTLILELFHQVYEKKKS